MGDTPNSNKRQRLMAPENDHSEDMAVAGPSNEASSPKLFKLTVDCFDEIFEYFSVKDLHSLGQTCKTMQKVAGVYFQRNFAAADKFTDHDGIYTVYANREGVLYERTQTSAFNQFMPYISHCDEAYDRLRYLKSHINEFQSTKYIHLINIRISQRNIGYFDQLLPNIETVQIRGCWMNENLYEMMLQYCKNIKRIYIQNTNSMSNGKHEWLLQDYPMLEHLELIPITDVFIDELNTFFERNPKVQRFSTSEHFLWFNRNQFLEFTMKLDILEVKEHYFRPKKEIMIRIWDVLNRLHKKGFYKRLFAFISSFEQDLSDQMTLVSDCLETLCIHTFNRSYSLPLLVNLKELIILNGLNATDAKILANSLVKLQRLYVDHTTIEDIIPFIRYSPALNKMKIFPKYNYDDRNLNRYIPNWRILNLAVLNKEREKCPGARKVTIYVQDDVFLATKWATKNGDINLSHIEMKRSDSYEWKLHY